MAHIDIDPTQTLIRIDSEYRERELCKQVPGARWNADDKVWKAPLSWASCITLRGVFGDALTVGEKLSTWAWYEFEQRVQPAAALRDALEEPELMTDEPALYPFQRAGVKFLQVARHALIADEMGAGKTVQIIRAIDRNYESLPVLIVCPNSMKFTWEREIQKWAPKLIPVVVDGTAAQRRKQLDQVATGDAHVAIINWEALRTHSRLESFGNRSLSESEKTSKELNDIKWETVVADEAHKAKDPNAKQTRALWAISRGASYRYAATGTPIANNPGDLWSIMNFVSPEDFPRKSKFVDRFCLLNWNAFGGMDITGLRPENAQEFHSIIDSRMIRRTKDIVLPHLPPKTYITREVTMPSKQAKAYYQMADRMLAEIDNGIAVATNPLAQLTRLSQFACASAEMTENDDVLLSDPSNKVDAMEEIVDEAEGEQIVVFAQSKQLINLAANRLRKKKIPFGLITGDVDPSARQDYIDAFQRGDLRVMLATLQAGGVGITLTAARIAVFLQRSWSMVDNKQAEDRIHRPGQTASRVEIIDIVSKGTVEELRAMQLEVKEDRLQEVVRDDNLRALLAFKGKGA